MLSAIRRLIQLSLGPLLTGDADLMLLDPSLPSLATWAAGITYDKNTNLEVPRPTIGGQHISWEYLTSISLVECQWRFRLYAHEIRDLADALRIPDPFLMRNGCLFPRIEALGLLLARYRTAGDQYDLTVQYCRSQSGISELVNDLSIWINDNWSHLLDTSDRNPVLTRDWIAVYAEAIATLGAPLTTIWCFLDCTIRFICRPSFFQQQAYNGYKGHHTLKYQAIKLPNGLIGALYGPVEGRRNDNHLSAASKLFEWCTANALRPGATAATSIEHQYFQIFGDPAYGVSPVLMSPFSRQGELTADEKAYEAMTAVRIEVEHGFADVIRLWPYLCAWWKHRVLHSPIGVYYRVGVLLANTHNCIRPNQTSQRFNCVPPTIQEYFINHTINEE